MKTSSRLLFILLVCVLVGQSTTAEAGRLRTMGMERGGGVYSTRDRANSYRRQGGYYRYDGRDSGYYRRRVGSPTVIKNCYGCQLNDGSYRRQERRKRYEHFWP